MIFSLDLLLRGRLTAGKFIVVHTDRDLCAWSRVSLSHCWRRWKRRYLSFRATLNQHSFEWTCDAFAVCFESGLTSSIVFVVWRELELSSCESWTSSLSWVGTKMPHANIGHSNDRKFWLQNANTFCSLWLTDKRANKYVWTANERENVSRDVWNCMHVAKVYCITSPASESTNYARLQLMSK